MTERSKTLYSATTTKAENLNAEARFISAYQKPNRKLYRIMQKRTWSTDRGSINIKTLCGLNRSLSVRRILCTKQKAAECVSLFGKG